MVYPRLKLLLSQQPLHCQLSLIHCQCKLRGKAQTIGPLCLMLGPGAGSRAAMEYHLVTGHNQGLLQG
jgi:hypothetical protein